MAVVDLHSDGDYVKVTPAIRDELTRIYNECSTGGTRFPPKMFIYDGKIYTENTLFEEFPEALQQWAREHDVN